MERLENPFDREAAAEIKPENERRDPRFEIYFHRA